MNTVTQEMVESAIAKEIDFRAGLKTCVVVLTLQNGFEVVGTAGVVDPDNYDHETGKRIARQNALNKVWELEGYLLQSKLVADADGVLRIDFAFDAAGEPSFTCSTKGLPFPQVRKAFEHCVVELQRQIKEQEHCPFFAAGAVEGDSR